MCVGGGGVGEEEEEEKADGSAQPKTRTPHNDVGNKKSLPELPEAESARVVYRLFSLHNLCDGREQFNPLVSKLNLW